MDIANFDNDRFETLRQMYTDALDRGENLRSVMTVEEIDELRQGFPIYNQKLRARVEAAREAGRKRMEEIKRLMAAQAQREEWLSMPV
jgi:hypothetical protein